MNKNQQENIDKKKKQLGREEYGYGYDISENDLNKLGQNELAKKNNTQNANHPINNDEK
ncbi:hypothetical protein [Paenisporosarcina sp. TG20]|uniref:hypothetical protein n=1 Tax=Paenisporosarcina sp. TG20 TaxID=1211706 RepID=UPI00030C5EEC|nr:hypothetical protein [Paenisporosarcina sp. TG20]